jgi:hypothetical protein
MEPEDSFPCSQGHATGPYSEPDEPVYTFPSYFSKIYSNIIFPSTRRSSE